jgi:hypothetical protein
MAEQATAILDIISQGESEAKTSENIIEEDAPKILEETIKEVNKENNMDKFEEIKKYKELLDMGIITQEEFDTEKKRIFM